MTNISNMFLAESWGLEAFYDFIKMEIWRDLVMFTIVDIYHF